MSKLDGLDAKQLRDLIMLHLIDVYDGRHCLFDSEEEIEFHGSAIVGDTDKTLIELIKKYIDEVYNISEWEDEFGDDLREDEED